MVRVSSKLRHSANLLLCCAAIAGCSSSDGDTADEGGVLREKLIQFSPMYSAFDGTHDYKLTPSVPIANPMSTDSDPVVATSLKWDVDKSFVNLEQYGDLPGAVLLTTKKAGSTTVKVSATTKSGLKIRGQAMLTISQATDEEWQAGETRYNGGTAIDFTMIRPTGGAAGGASTCGFPIDLSTILPKTSACSNCHNTMSSSISVEHTPTQTAGYSNDQLVQIFTQGEKPAGVTFNSPILRAAPMPDCIYKSFHTWEIDDATKKGIIWKLRSIAPKNQAAIDFSRLAQMAMDARAARAAGAAGAAPAADGAAGSAP